MSADIINLETRSTRERYTGQYLKKIKRKTKGGTRFEYWFKPKAESRPTEWLERYPASIRLPRDRSMRHGLDPDTNPSEYAKAFEEAAPLFAELQKLRSAPVAGGSWPHGSVRWLVKEWARSDWFLEDLGEKTQRLYEQQIATIEGWADRKAEEHGGIHGHISQLKPKHIADMLHEFDDRPTKRRHLKIVWRNICSYAIELGLMDRNPVNEVVTRRTRGLKKVKVLWTQAFVDLAVKWARENDRPEAEAMVLLMWDCGRRPEDIFRLTAITDIERQALENGTLNADGRPMLYDARQRAIMGWVHKTGNYIQIPLDKLTVAAIDTVCPAPDENRRHVFAHFRTGEVYADSSWKYVWGAMRKWISDQDGMGAFSQTTWQQGRASSIVRSKRAGLDDAEITTLSDHSNPRTVYRHYWVPDAQQATDAKRKRAAAEETK